MDKILRSKSKTSRSSISPENKSEFSKYTTDSSTIGGKKKEISLDGFIVVPTELWDSIPNGSQIRYVNKHDGELRKGGFVTMNAGGVITFSPLPKDYKNNNTIPPIRINLSNIETLYKRFNPHVTIELAVLSKELENKIMSNIVSKLETEQRKLVLDVMKNELKDEIKKKVNKYMEDNNQPKK